MGRPAVVGADAIAVDLVAKTITVDGTELHEGDLIAIDGSLGRVTVDDVPLVEVRVDANFEQVPIARIAAAQAQIASPRSGWD